MTINSDAMASEHIEKMGSKLGPVYSALWQQVAWVHCKWEQYVDLFGTNPERVSLLNETAPLFFNFVQNSFLDDIILSIARLTDPAKSRGRDKDKENLSLKQLPLLLDQTLQGEVNEKLDLLGKTTSFARKWRNKKQAHNDLDLALLSREAEALVPASQKRVEDAIAAMSEVLNIVERHFLGSTTCFRFPASSPGGASCLLVYLKQGRKAELEYQKLISMGMETPEDRECRTIR